MDNIVDFRLDTCTMNINPRCITEKILDIGVGSFMEQYKVASWRGFHCIVGVYTARVHCQSNTYHSSY